MQDIAEFDDPGNSSVKIVDAVQPLEAVPVHKEVKPRDPIDLKDSKY